MCVSVCVCFCLLPCTVHAVCICVHIHTCVYLQSVYSLWNAAMSQSLVHPLPQPWGCVSARLGDLQGKYWPGLAWPGLAWPGLVKGVRKSASWWPQCHRWLLDTWALLIMSDINLWLVHLAVLTFRSCQIETRTARWDSYRDNVGLTDRKSVV